MLAEECCRAVQPVGEDNAPCAARQWRRGMTSHFRRGNQKRLAAAAADLERQFQVRPKMTVALVKIVQPFDEEPPDHQRAERCVFHWRGRRIQIQHQARQRIWILPEFADYRRIRNLPPIANRLPGRIDYQRTCRRRVAVSVHHCGERRGSIRSEFHLRSEEENVVAGGGSHADVQRFGCAEIPRQPQDRHVREIVALSAAAVGRPVVHYQDFHFGAVGLRFKRCQAAA